MVTSGSMAKALSRDLVAVADERLAMTSGSFMVPASAVSMVAPIRSSAMPGAASSTGPLVTRRARDRRLLIPEQRERFFDKERRDAEVWPRLTEKQRRMPYWQQREAQWGAAGRIALIFAMAGEELPEALRRRSGVPEEASPRPLSPSDVVDDLINRGLFGDCRER